MARLTISLLLLTLACCGGSGSQGASTTSATTTQAQWTREGQVMPNITSSCAMAVGGVYRMYYMLNGNFVSATSSDGRDFGAPTIALSRTAGELISNPAVAMLDSGEYMMIFNKKGSGGRDVFLRATSPDGITFTRYAGSLEEKAVMAPNAEENGFISVPDLVTFGGLLHIYYVANKSVNRIFHAASADGGITWTRTGRIILSGVDPLDKTVDPDVMLLPDGRLRLFFAYGLQSQTIFGGEGIYSAVSSDGVSFTVEGAILPPSSAGFTIDPDVVELIGRPGVYRMYIGEPVSNGGSLSLNSAISQ